MTIDTKTIVSIPEANSDSSRVARSAEKITDLEQMDDIELTDDEKIDLVARRILKEYRSAFEELAKG